MIGGVGGRLVSTTTNMYEWIVKLLAVVLALPVTAILRGYALSWVWLWFIVPIWGWSPLSVGQSIGITFVIGVLVPNQSTKNDEDKNEDSEQFWRLLFKAVFTPIVTLAMGWVLHQFI